MTADGKLLTQIYVENSRNFDNIIIYENTSKNEIYICDSHCYATAICLDTQFWTEKYSVHKCFGVVNDTALCLGDDYTITASHIYSTEELISMGKEIVG